MAGIDERGERVFIGRHLELARLQASLTIAGTGRPRVAVITGEAGIGKSSLLAEAVRRAEVEGWLHIGGSCLELQGGQIPYLPFVEALRSLVTRVPLERVRPLVWPARQALGRLLPELAIDSGVPDSAPDRAAGGEGGDLDRARLFESLLTVANRLAGAQPLLVTIEDIQWADSGTLDLVRFFVHGLTVGPLMLVLTERTDGPTRSATTARWLAELERSESVERLALGPFGRPEVAAQLEAVVGRPPDPDAVSSFLARSGGNPFLVQELARTDPASDPGDESLPAALRDLLLAQVATLSDPAQAVVRVVAAAGRVVSDDLLTRVVGRPEAEVAVGLREAVDHGILVAVQTPGTDGYAFRHPLLREVVAAGLLPIEARQLHRAYAAALTTIDARSWSAAEAAFHWDAAGDAGRAVEASIEAAESAESVFAFGEARAHYERALGLWEVAPYADDRLPLDRIAVMDRAAAMAALVGDHRRAVDLAREALSAIDPAVDAARAAHFHSALRWYLWDAGDRAAALTDALEAVRLMPTDPPTPELANVQAHAAGLLLFAGRLSAAASEATKALSTARTAGARAEEALALGVLGWLEVARGEPDHGVELVREAWRIARELGHVTGIAVAYNHLAAALEAAGRVRESLDVAREGIAEAERLGTARSFGAMLEGNAAHALFRLGRWDEAEAMTETALARGVASGPLAWLRVVRARLFAARGRFAAAEGELRAIEAARDPEALAPYLGWWYATRAELATWHERPAAALEIVGSAFADARLPELDASATTLAALGLGAAADVGESEPPGSPRADEARVAGERIEARARATRRGRRRAPPDLPTAGPTGGHGVQTAMAALIEAEAARFGGRQAGSAWRRLLSAAEVEERPPLEAYARFRWAAAILAGQGDRDRAGTLLREAHEAAIALEAVPLRSRIEDLARRARIALGPPVGTDPGTDRPYGLTERELEVLALVVDGRSNREIGELLFISPKTASVHVSNILAKLEVDGRVEAATMALRVGLISAGGAGPGGGGLTHTRCRGVESELLGR